MIKHHGQKQLGEERVKLISFVSLRSSSIAELNWGRNLEAGATESMEGCCLLAFSASFVQLALLLSASATHHGLGPPTN